MESAKSSEFMVSEVKFDERRFSKERVVTISLLAVAFIFMIVGIVLMAVAASEKEVDKECTTPSSHQGHQEGQALSTPAATMAPSSRCDFSEEAQKSGLAEFLHRVKSTYYKLHPYDVHDDPEVTTDQVKTEYVAYDPKPSAIKNRTVTALELLKEINEKQINTDRLNPREKKALAQVKHYLEHAFGQPNGANYFSGDWMMVPNMYCTQEICDHGNAVSNGIGGHHKPHSVRDVEDIERKLKTHKQSFLQYIKNLKMGISAGMVRSKEACKVGLDAIRKKYLNIYLYNETGVLKEWFVKPLLDNDFYSDLTKEVHDQWKQNNAKNISETIKEYLVTYLGKPINKLLRYLETEHTRHCVPSNVSSGLATLPLKYVWLDGKENKSWPTNSKLPTGEPLNGSQAYLNILSYYTTNSQTPLEVSNLGREQLDKFYPTIVAAAKEVTGISDNETEAVIKFKQKLNSSEMYYNTQPIPKNESDEEAHKKCRDIEGAKKYCPKRWEALQLWIADSIKVMSLIEPKTLPMFYFTKENATTPACPIEMIPILNPSYRFQSYEPGDADCTKSAQYGNPLFKENLGPKFEEYGASSNMLRPGQHTQRQGNIEHFQDSCGGVIGWLDGVSSNTAFTKGWNAYAEEYVLEETDIYDNNPLQKYGMLKWEVVRALRMIIDPGLHYFGMKRDEAIELFSKYTWDDTEMARTEVTRYQSVPGRTPAYMIGQLMIKEIREYAKKKLGQKFSLRDFHYQILAQGSSPLAYLKEHVEKYVACVKNKEAEGCDIVLNPPKKTSQG